MMMTWRRKKRKRKQKNKIRKKVTTLMRVLEWKEVKKITKSITILSRPSRLGISNKEKALTLTSKILQKEERSEQISITYIISLIFKKSKSIL